LLLSIIFLHY